MASVLLHVVLFYTAVATAIVCPSNSTNHSRRYVVPSQKDWSLSFGPECTTIVAYSFEISDAFEGVLDLSGITNITAALTADGAAGLTNIIFDDLEYLGRGQFGRTGMTSFSFPKLQRSKKIEITNSLPTDIDLPVLVDADLVFDGNIKSLNLPLLRNSTYLTIKNAYSRNDFYPSEKGDYNFTATEINVNLPQLETVHRLQVEGNFSEVLLPNLKTVFSQYRDDDGSVKSDGRMIMSVPRVNISLPLLYNLSSDISRLIFDQSISMPSLVEASGWFSLRPEKSSNITLPRLESADRLEIWGVVSIVSLPSLKSINELKVSADSGSKLDCKDVAVDYKRVNSSYSEEHCEYLWSCNFGCKVSTLESSPEPTVGGSPAPTLGSAPEPKPALGARFGITLGYCAACLILTAAFIV